MKQREIARWLKGICIVVAIMGLIFFGVIVPELATASRATNPKLDFLFWPSLISAWFIGVLCYVMLYQFWKVCVQIGKDNSFSSENAKSFVVISRTAVLISILCFCGMLILGISHWLSPGIGMLLIGMIFIVIVIAIMAAALSHLILKAYELKKENELTI